MTMNNNDVIKTMNDLIETSRDGEQGFRTCAQGVTSPNLKTLFEAAARVPRALRNWKLRFAVSVDSPRRAVQ